MSAEWELILQINVLDDVIQKEIQTTTLQSKSFTTYNRFHWIFYRTMEELQAILLETSQFQMAAILENKTEKKS